MPNNQSAGSGSTTKMENRKPTIKSSGKADIYRKSFTKPKQKQGKVIRKKGFADSGKKVSG